MAGGDVVLKATSVHIGVLIHLWFILVSIEGWTYHWTENETMSWNESREWCKNHYTDIVMVHNENVTRFLKENVKNITSPYYWIGLQKSKDTWMWVANGQTAKYLNWAPYEPNNKSDEKCVELYTSKTPNNGKWNDDNCQLKKHPLCQKAHCLNDTCTDRQDCKEQVNSFTCVCKHGFSGPKCETAECFPVLLFGGGLMNCTEGHDSNRSACRVQCPPGNLLLGFVEFTCRADGTWESSFPLICASYVHFLFALLASVVISVFFGCLFCCSNCSRSKNAVRLRTQQEMVNPANEAEH